MIVSNTTPISNLLHLEKLSIIFDLFGDIHIPEAVAKEVDIFFSHNKHWKSSLAQDKIIIDQISNAMLVKQLMPFLHQGEAEVLCLALEKKARLCLIDDKDGRNVATMNDIPVSGTLGILLKAKERGLISSIRSFLDALRTGHRFWIQADLYHKVLSLAKEDEK